MKKLLILFWQVSTTFCLFVHGQAVNSISPQSQNPGYLNFHSNLGVQEIIQIGTPKNLGPIRHSNNQNFPVVERLGVLAEKENELKPTPLEESEFFTENTSQISNGNPGEKNNIELSTSAGLRIYRTSNVLRVKTDADASGVVETNLGVGVSHSGLGLRRYITMIPRLDLMVKWANYSDNKVSDLLDHRFSLAKASLVINFPGDWVVTPAIEYNLLNNQSNGNRMFDAVAPSINVQKATVFNERSILLTDVSLKLANTDKVVGFAAPGIFADDGDNFQSSLYFTYVQLFGDENELLLMPSMGVTRSLYLKDTHDGRIDYLLNLGLTGIYQWKPWLGFQTFLNFSKMSTNEKGEELLGSSSSSKTFDLGFAITGNYQF
ncbi:MAG: hypothetical protein ACJZ64_02800 [Opitutales bacterium]